jgi:hypothetical protein
MADEKLLYDVYDLRFEGLSLLLTGPDSISRSIIDEISYEAEVLNCLEPLHPLFPSIKVNQLFRLPIKFVLEADTLKIGYEAIMLLVDQLSTEGILAIDKQLKEKEAANAKVEDLQA